MNIVVASDHGGYELKRTVLQELPSRGLNVIDVGCHSKDSVDYPDYASMAVKKIINGDAEQGILICTTGIGMSISANKFHGIRAALCLSPEMATKARSHNDANVLVLGASYVSADLCKLILDAWFGTNSPVEVRHKRRVNKINCNLSQSADMSAIGWIDKQVYGAVEKEIERQQMTLNLIASENYVSPAVRQAQGSIMTNKYAEGYPAKRWYNGCVFVDEVENLAIERAKLIFGAEHVNVQPHCGSSANMAVYFSALKPGDTILAMKLAHGGHLTHGSEVNFSGKLFNFVPYGVSQKDERIDFNELARLAKEYKPRLIVAGASAYPRILEFEKFAQIAESIGAILMVDMAHIAGLVASGVHPNPVPFAQYVTTTTHKTLRGPRSGMIICKAAYAADIDKQVFPGLQGGPFMHVIAAKAVCFEEALQPEFKAYGRQVVANARVMADLFLSAGLKLVSGGTDNHLMLINLESEGITGKQAAEALDNVGIIVNKNVVPFDKKSPFITSGIRIGTAALTTRGMKENEMRRIASMIVELLRHMDDETVIKRIRGAVKELALAFPVP